MDDKKKSILFVCIENSCRSQIAEAFAKIHGEGIIDAYSSGSKPSGKVNPKAIESLKEIGYNLSSHTSKSLDELPDIEFEYAITMGCGDECPFVKAKYREDWALSDPKGLDKIEFNKIRDLIGAKVKELISKIKEI